MNIFVLDEDPVKAAQAMDCVRVPKMVTESAQMLASALRRRGATDEQMPLTKSGTPYKGGYKHHPCTVWAGDSFANWNWLWNHGMALCEEYEKRFGREHACYEPISFMGSTTVHWPHPHVLTPFALAMPDEYRPNHQPRVGPTFQEGQMIYRSEVKGDSHASGDDAVQAYRRYYHSKTFARWEKGTPAPDWWQGTLVEVKI